MNFDEKATQLQTQYEENLARLKMPTLDTKINNQNTNNDFDNYCQTHLEHLKKMGDILEQTPLRSNSHSILQRASSQVDQLQRLHHSTLDTQKKEISQNYQIQLQNLQQTQTRQMETILQQSELRNKQQASEIDKLKKDKKEMISIVQKKLQDAQYLHREELKKERTITKALSDELKEEREIFFLLKIFKK